MKRKIIALFLSLLMLIPLVSCSNHPEPTEDTTATTASSKGQTNADIEGTTLFNAVGKCDENGLFVVPDGIEFIRESAFAGDTKVKEIVLPSSVTTIGSGAFYGCTSLEKITMTDNVTSIGSEAFYGCLSLREVTIPKGITSLLYGTFGYCQKLESVELPEGLTSIGESAFVSCTSLSEVLFSKTVVEVGSSAFSGCSALIELIGFDTGSIQTIDSGAFNGCSSLQRITLPSSLKSIGGGAFQDCTSLYEIQIPDSVTTIGAFALSSTQWFYEQTDKYVIVGDGVLVKCNANPLASEKPGQLDLSNLKIKSIGNSCFADAYSYGYATRNGYKYIVNLKEVILPEGLTQIGAYAFFGCLNIENLVLPTTIESIGASAFYGLLSGEYSYLNTSFSKCTLLKSIGSEAFYGCTSLSDLDLPASLTSVGDNAFTETGAYYHFIESSAAENSGNKFYIAGDGVLLWTYIAKDETSIVIPDSVKVIAGGACSGWDSQLVYEDFENIASLSEAAKSRLRATYNVTSLVIPDGVTSIEEYAFLRLGVLSEIVIPDSVLSVSTGAFMMCASVTSVKLGNSLQYLGAYSLAYTSITQVSLPDTLMYIGASAFSNCVYLTSVSLPLNLVSYGIPVIDTSCSSLTDFSISESMRSQITTLASFESGNVMVHYLSAKQE